MASIENHERADTFSLSIRLRHEKAELSSLATGLSLPISKVWKAGDLIRTASGNPTGSARTGSYLSSRVSTSEDLKLLPAVLESCLCKLQHHAKVIRRFIEEGGTVEFLIGWFFEGTSGLEIQPAILARMGDLGISYQLWPTAKLWQYQAVRRRSSSEDSKEQMRQMRTKAVMS
jgi:hypothetical protein